MNKMKHILLFLPVVMLLAACTQDELTDNGQGTPLPERIPLQLTASIGEAVATPATRATTVDGQWPDKEDNIVYVQIAKNEAELDGVEVLKYTVDANGNLTPPSDVEIIYWENTTQTFYIRAWYPGGRTDWNDTPKEDIQWTAGIDQSTEADLAKDDFLYAYQTLTFSTQPHKLDFKHLMSKITINLVSSDYLMQYAPEKVSVSLSYADLVAPPWYYIGNFSGNGSGLELGYASGKLRHSITPLTLSVPNMGYYASYKAIVIPQGLNNKTIEVEVGNAQYKWSMNLPIEMKSGHEYTFNITVGAKGLQVQIDTSIGWGADGANGSGSVTLP